MSAFTPLTSATWPRPAGATVILRAATFEFGLLLAAFWLLAPTCFALPGRVGPTELGSLDTMAISKMLFRGAALALTNLLLLRLNTSPRTVSVLARVAPFGLFALWCVASTIWSPLKIVTLGHSLELIILLQLAICAGILVDTEDKLKSLMFHLFVAMFLITLVATILEFPSILAGERPSDYMHPNTLGAISGDGLLLLLAGRFLWNWRWARIMFVPGLAVCGYASFVARSRTALLSTIVMVAVLMWTHRRRALFVVTFLIAGAMFAFGPYVERVANIPETIGNYMTRGQSQDELMAANGRDEIWALALESFRESPLFGDGYFMISPSGAAYVWQKKQYQTAHNLALHVITGTGIIGGLLFLWGCWHVLAAAFRDRHDHLMYVLLLLSGWFLIGGFFELSILSPIDPTGAAFFLILGATVGPRAASGAPIQCA